MVIPKKITSEELLHRLRQADSCEMDGILHAVRNRYRELYPDTDFVLMSIPKNDPKERDALWRWLVNYVHNHEIPGE